MSGAFDAWVGRVEEAVDTVTLTQARQMAATLGAPEGATDDAPLPPLWHWMGWQTHVPMAGLGPDGHPARGGFLPPVPLPRRMWAGGRLAFHASLPIGAAMERRSEIVKIAEKTGSTGPMVFVTVAHRISGPDGLAVTEEQDIVYAAMPNRFSPPPKVVPPAAPVWQEAEVMNTARLFRFSALTFNAHKIHYDLPYAQTVEKYPGLVVHGPMQAMLLIGAAARHAGRTPRAFRFRGVHPLFHTDALTLMGETPSDGVQALSAVAGGAHVTMQAQAEWGAA